jgi:hypothetical protein
VRLPHKIRVVEWYEAEGDGTHYWADSPSSVPAIRCESEEQADALLAAYDTRERRGELTDALKKIDDLLEPEVVVKKWNGVNDIPHIRYILKCGACGAEESWLNAERFIDHRKECVWKIAHDALHQEEESFRDSIRRRATARGPLPANFIGGWPGNETDEELLKALADLDGSKTDTGKLDRDLPPSEKMIMSDHTSWPPKSTDNPTRLYNAEFEKANCNIGLSVEKAHQQACTAIQRTGAPPPMMARSSAGDKFIGMSRGEICDRLAAETVRRAVYEGAIRLVFEAVGAVTFETEENPAQHALSKRAQKERDEACQERDTALRAASRLQRELDKDRDD